MHQIFVFFVLGFSLRFPAFRCWWASLVLLDCPSLCPVVEQLELSSGNRQQWNSEQSPTIIAGFFISEISCILTLPCDMNYLVIELFMHGEEILHNVGYLLIISRYTMERPRFTDNLEAIKFICKEFWSELFKKQIDNLKTNHKVRSVVRPSTVVTSK